MVSKVLFSSKTTEWETPQHIITELSKIHSFQLDAAATKDNAKCEKYITKEQDALTQDWYKLSGGGDVWLNPPYGRGIGKWVRKAYEESQKGCTVVCLLPVRTDTKWFHDWVLNKGDIIFIRGRWRFGGATNTAPFPSMIVVYSPD
jgi:phage N-6-adenine-methyltransferase